MRREPHFSTIDGNGQHKAPISEEANGPTGSWSGLNEAGWRGLLFEARRIIAANFPVIPCQQEKRARSAPPCGTKQRYFSCLPETHIRAAEK
jgi:hypothetical protein